VTIDSASPLASAPVSILLVDDEIRNLDVLESLLQSPDYNLVRALTAERALRELLEGEFAVIVLDIQMPEMSGIELANLIKQRKRTQHIPIIFLTAYFQEDKDVLQGYNIGAVDYLTKPINPQILKSKISVFVDLFRKTRALAASNDALEQEVAQRERAEQALRHLNNELEERVLARTAELVHVNEELRERGKALRESEKRFRNMADHAPMMLWVTDPEGACTYLNRGWYEFTGQTPDTALGFAWFDAVHPDEQTSARALFTAANEHRTPFRLEYRLRRNDGAFRWAINAAAPRFDETGEFLGYIGSVIDITERKQTEEISRATAERLRMAMTASNLGDWSWDAATDIVTFSQRGAEIFGLHAGPVLTWGRLRDLLHPDDRERARIAVEEALAKHAEYDVEYRVMHPNGSVRWVAASGRGIYGPTGQVQGMLGIVQDVTERRLAQEELKQARDVALAASMAKDNFMATLSHELRTPLNPALLLATEAANNPELPPEVRADFESIAKNVALEARLIDDLLDLTRIARGKLSLDLGVHDLHAVLGEAIETVRAELEEKRISLSLDLGAGSSHVNGDGVRLQQILWNVLKNAVKFTPEGGRVSVQTRSDPAKNCIRISVTDTGIGLTEAEIGRIFEAFSQGDHAAQISAHRYGGVGLGLTISRMLVEQHAGNIRAVSEGRDRGATFIIELPLCPANDAIAAQEPGPGPAAAATQSANGHRTRILLVEDHEPTRTTLMRLLMRRRYDVVSAACVTEARAVAGQGTFDLVISDIGLPDGNGYELMMELRDRHGLKKGIALTGYGMEQDVARSQAAGFMVHLVKPVRVQALDDALATASRS
jgi:PAS domain S-box-containing protein